MGSKIEDIVDSIRRIVSRWVITTTTLTESASAGDTIITVDNTLRFHKGDEIVLRDALQQTEPEPGLLYVQSVIDDTHLELTEPLQLAWPLVNGPSIFKSIKGQYVKAVYTPEPAVIPQFPAVTVTGQSRSSEWLTTRGTKERYNIEIGVFVEDATMEDGYRFLCRLTDLIQEGLKRNVYPLVNDYDLIALTADMQPLDDYIKVADTSLLECFDRILIETKYRIFESQIVEIVDGNTIRIFPTSDALYKVSDGATLIRCHRFIYNSWPAEINYGQIAKGSLLRAASISFFAEEFEVQFRGSYSDPQLK
jgi:hypothetical protein